ncbi:MAG: AMP-binding protein [Bacteroidetes bacterium]|nr:AMP-binding protein [Bacteroidota bacterium]
MTDTNFRTIDRFLTETAHNHPEKGAGYIRSDGSVSFHTYPEILRSALKILSGLQNLGLVQHDTLMFSFDKNEEIIPVLWACFLGGFVPTLLQPPVSFTEHNAAAEKMERVYHIFGEPRLLISDSLAHRFSSGVIPPEKIIRFTDLSGAPDNPILPVIREDDLAFVQFSSGSTGDPKGIMLTHRNIVTNVSDITEGIRIMPHDSSVNWMPLFHDMGLIGFVLTPSRHGCNHYFIETGDFVKKPMLWLDIVSNLKATITASPNFGLALVNRYLSRKPQVSWDLSSVKTIMNGAEPISIRIMNHFLDELAPYGLRRSAMLPCYGLAESTLATTFSPFATEPKIISISREKLVKENVGAAAESKKKSHISLVSVGRPLPHVTIRIVNEDGLELPPGNVGHIQIKGDNVTSGYYNNPDATGDLFSGEWLRTGDLGLFYENDLYITGRFKDIIFVNSKNHYAHDLENIAMSLPDITFGKIAIAGIFDERKGMDKVLVFLVAPENEATMNLFKQLQELFNTSVGIRIDHFIPVKSTDLPRTSSGKIQRYLLVNRFLQNGYPAVISI